MASHARTASLNPAPQPPFQTLRPKHCPTPSLQRYNPSPAAPLQKILHSSHDFFRPKTSRFESEDVRDRSSGFRVVMLRFAGGRWACQINSLGLTIAKHWHRNTTASSSTLKHATGLLHRHQAPLCGDHRPGPESLGRRGRCGARHVCRFLRASVGCCSTGSWSSQQALSFGHKPGIFVLRETRRKKARR